MPRYDEAEAREAVAQSKSYAEALRRMGVNPAGGNHRLFKKWIARWEIDTGHFDPNAARIAASHRRARTLDEILIEDSPAARKDVKSRLLREGLKQPLCEECGQGEIWRGKRIALILDHINGVPNDHRLENLRIVCPNCAATLDTHCGRHNHGARLTDRQCDTCGVLFAPRSRIQRFCSVECFGLDRTDRLRGVAQPELRKVERPPYAQLMQELRETNYSAVGRKYGVSDNAVRKWVRQYEREIAVGKLEDAA